MTQLTDAFRLAELIASDFYEDRLYLSARGGVAGSPWSRMPAVECVRRLRASGTSNRTVRLFLTFIAAMNRARESSSTSRIPISSSLPMRQPSRYANFANCCLNIESADATGPTRTHGTELLAA